MRIVQKKRVNINNPTNQRQRSDRIINNSHEECMDKHQKKLTETEQRVLEQKLIEFVHSKGYKIIPMMGDGNCMFRAIAHQIYGDQDMHDQIRKLTLDYMVTERDYFSQYIIEDFDEYIERKRQNGCFGNSTELQAISELFNRPVEVYSNGAEPLNIFNSEVSNEVPLRVSYHNGNHYNAVVDPEHATVGVGLGLPDFHPGAADRSQVEKAVELSEMEQLEQAMIESVASDTEHKEINQSVEDAIIQQSRNEYWQQVLQSALENKPQ